MLTCSRRPTQEFLKPCGVDRSCLETVGVKLATSLASGLRKAAVSGSPASYQIWFSGGADAE